MNKKIKTQVSLNLGEMVKSRAISFSQVGINPEKEKYFKKYKNAENIYLKNEKKYIKENNIDGKEIDSVNHPKYFKIIERFDRIRKKLFEPILSTAYYKAGDTIVFVEKNDCITSERRKYYGNTLLMKDKVIYNVVDIENPEKESKTPTSIYYENALMSAIVERVTVSYDGLGDIRYYYSQNNYVAEADIITNFDEFLKNLKK